jgi:hypothetical protein
VDLLSWITALGCVVALVMWASTIRSAWRGRGPRHTEPPSSWRYGRALWRAGQRLVPMAGPLSLLVLLALVFERSDADGPVAAALAAMLGPLGALLLVLMVSIALFNVPKRVVAPHLRSEPGALREWFGRGRR